MTVADEGVAGVGELIMGGSGALGPAVVFEPGSIILSAVLRSAKSLWA